MQKKSEQLNLKALIKQKHYIRIFPLSFPRLELKNHNLRLRPPSLISNKWSYTKFKLENIQCKLPLTNTNWLLCKFLHSDWSISIYAFHSNPRWRMHLLIFYSGNWRVLDVRAVKCIFNIPVCSTNNDQNVAKGCRFSKT